MAAVALHLIFILTSGEIINRYEERSMNESEIKCEDSSCSINCIADKSCTSSYSLDAFVPFEIHCPSQPGCTECNVNCYGKYSCYATFIYIYSCSNVNIIGTRSYSLHEATITNDAILSNNQHSAFLYISNNETYLSSNNNQISNFLSYLTINNQNIANIKIDCFGNSDNSKNECNSLRINNNMTPTNISLYCHPNADCSRLSLQTNNGILKEFMLECDANSDCTKSNIGCGISYESYCEVLVDVKHSMGTRHCNCIQQAKIIDDTAQNNSSASWIKTNYAIPMIVVCGILILCLIGSFVKTMRGCCSRNVETGMLRYEIRDEKELEKESELKMWIKAKIMKNAHGKLNQNEDEIDELQTQRRTELENLSALTRSELIDSDDEMNAIMGGIQSTGSGTMGYQL